VRGEARRGLGPASTELATPLATARRGWLFLGENEGNGRERRVGRAHLPRYILRINKKEGQGKAARNERGDNEVEISQGEVAAS